jgi:hypothetical protein
MPPAGPVSAFWRWFAANEARFRAVAIAGTARDALLDEIQEQLHTVNPQLYFEIGSARGGPTQLVITAAGRRDLFAVVHDLVVAAPALEGWSFVALKPAAGFEFEAQYGAATVDPEACWFLPLESAAEPGRLGVLVGCPGFDPAVRQDFENAVLVALDTGLGEQRAAEQIGHVEVGPLPRAPAEEGLIELPELPAFLDWWRAHRAHRAH